MLKNAAVVLPEEAGYARHVYALYIIRAKNRDKLQLHLSRKAITTLIHYPVPPHLQKVYKSLKYRKGDFPITEEYANTVLSLPLYPEMDRKQIEHVASAISEFTGLNNE